MVLESILSSNPPNYSHTMPNSVEREGVYCEKSKSYLLEDKV